jgi:hypothetical protein
MLSDGSLAMCCSGRYAAGEANSRRAYDASSKAFGLSAALTQAVGSTVATCLIGLNRLDEASKLLQGIDVAVAAVAQLAGDPDWGAGVQLLQADIAYRRHDYETARKLIQAVTPVFTRKDAEAYQKPAVETLTADLEKLASK